MQFSFQFTSVTVSQVSRRKLMPTNESELIKILSKLQEYFQFPAVLIFSVKTRNTINFKTYRFLLKGIGTKLAVILIELL